MMSDIDGTLLDDNSQLSVNTKEMITKFSRSKRFFVTASARTKVSTLAAIGDLASICSAYAYANGGYVETQDGRCLVDNPIKSSTLKSILKIEGINEASVCCVGINQAQAFLREPVCDKAFSIFDPEYKKVCNTNDLTIKTYLMAIYNKNIKKIYNTIKTEFKQLQVSPISKSPSIGLDFIFIQDKRSSKGNALKAVSKHLQIPVAETVAIGDQISNDGPMIKAAGLGVAMKNAGKELKGMADMVTRYDNDNDGLASFINEHLCLRS